MLDRTLAWVWEIFGWFLLVCAFAGNPQEAWTMKPENAGAIACWAYACALWNKADLAEKEKEESDG